MTKVGTEVSSITPILAGCYGVAPFNNNNNNKTKSDENKLMIFERKILRRISEPKRNKEGDYEIRSNREVNNLFNEPNIAAMLKSQRLRWAGHV